MTGLQEVTLPDDATIADLIRQLEVDEQLVCLVAVNGRAAEPTTLLAEGDSVDLIPPITGGGKPNTPRPRGRWA